MASQDQEDGQALKSTAEMSIQPFWTIGLQNQKMSDEQKQLSEQYLSKVNLSIRIKE
jgi:hypothetical protein